MDVGSTTRHKRKYLRTLLFAYRLLLLAGNCCLHRFSRSERFFFDWWLFPRRIGTKTCTGTG